jgi:hypothetical protein
VVLAVVLAVEAAARVVAAIAIKTKSICAIMVLLIALTLRTSKRN